MELETVILLTLGIAILIVGFAFVENTDFPESGDLGKEVQENSKVGEHAVSGIQITEQIGEENNKTSGEEFPE